MRTKILEVTQPPDQGALAGGAIDRPAAGDERADWTLEVRGWAVGRDGPVAAVKALCEGAVLWEVPLMVERPQRAAEFPQADTERIGFYAVQSVLGLPPRHEVEVRAALPGGGEAQVGSIRAERVPLRTGYQPRRQPILITTFGRTGSMLLMRLLVSHPEVVPFKPYRFEQRIASYWIDALLRFADPVSYLRGVAPQAGVDDPLWWIGNQAPMPWPLQDEGVQAWLGGEAVEQVAAVAQQRIDALYDRIAAGVGAGGEPFFAEKSNLRVSQVGTELYPDGREIFLVRDFRDMVASVFAYNRKRGVTGFGRAKAGTDTEYVERLGGWVDSLARAWKQREGRAHMVRYEDLVLQPEQALAPLLEYVGIDAGTGTIRQMVARLTDDIPELREHGTTDSPRSSIGRWRADFDDDLAAACASSFGRTLELFGYEST